MRSCEQTYEAMRQSAVWRLILGVAVASLLSACGRFGGEQPTRTPFPTFTPTSLAAGNVQAGNQVQVQSTQAAPAVATVPPTPVPATATPVPSPTFTQSPTPPPTDTPQPTPTPSETPTPSPTPTPAYTFDLERAEKFPTESLASDVVRIYLYVYSPQEFGLEGYSLQVLHNGALLPVDQLSVGGLPEQTRSEPSPYTRFTNMNVIFVESQAGGWRVQLVNSAGVPVGPPAEFELTADEETRELYVRYRRK